MRIPPTEAVILDLEMTGDLDLAGIEMLDELHSELQDLGVRLRLARLQRSARVLLARTKISRKIGATNFHPRTLFAVATLLRRRGGAPTTGMRYHSRHDQVRAGFGTSEMRTGNRQRPGNASRISVASSTASLSG